MNLKRTCTHCKEPIKNVSLYKFKAFCSESCKESALKSKSITKLPFNTSNPIPKSKRMLLRKEKVKRKRKEKKEVRALVDNFNLSFADARTLVRKRQCKKLKLSTEVILSKEFYDSQEWKTLRYKVLNEHKRECVVCGATRASGAILHVDHKKPRSVFPLLALDYGNLQILCRECNLGKSNIFF